MIPLAIAIGIVEDKIANDLTSKDTKARECLEDVKAKLITHAPKQTKIGILFKDFGLQEFSVDDLKFENGFVIATINGAKNYFNNDMIDKIYEPFDTEDDYVEGTIRGLKDL